MQACLISTCTRCVPLIYSHSKLMSIFIGHINSCARRWIPPSPQYSSVLCYEFDEKLENSFDVVSTIRPIVIIHRSLLSKLTICRRQLTVSDSFEINEQLFLFFFAELKSAASPVLWVCWCLSDICEEVKHRVKQQRTRSTEWHITVRKEKECKERNNTQHRRARELIAMAWNYVCLICNLVLSSSSHTPSHFVLSLEPRSHSPPLVPSCSREKSRLNKIKTSTEELRVTIRRKWCCTKRQQKQRQDHSRRFGGGVRRPPTPIKTLIGKVSIDISRCTKKTHERAREKWSEWKIETWHSSTTREAESLQLGTLNICIFMLKRVSTALLNIDWVMFYVVHVRKSRKMSLFSWME